VKSNFIFGKQDEIWVTSSKKIDSGFLISNRYHYNESLVCTKTYYTGKPLFKNHSNRLHKILIPIMKLNLFETRGSELYQKKDLMPIIFVLHVVLKLYCENGISRWKEGFIFSLLIFMVLNLFFYGPISKK
jgi:hypothetical protein